MSSAQTRVRIEIFAANFRYERGKNAIQRPAAAVAVVTEITTSVSVSMVEDTRRYVLQQPGSYTLVASLRGVAAISPGGPEFMASPSDRSNSVHITIVK
jgi:hypothetical protein